MCNKRRKWTSKKAAVPGACVVRIGLSHSNILILRVYGRVKRACGENTALYEKNISPENGERRALLVLLLRCDEKVSGGKGGEEGKRRKGSGGRRGRKGGGQKGDEGGGKGVGNQKRSRNTEKG